MFYYLFSPKFNWIKYIQHEGVFEINNQERVVVAKQNHMQQ